MTTKGKLKTLSWSPFFPGSASISILLPSPPVLSGTGGWWIGLAVIMLLLCCAASLLLFPPCNLPLLKWGPFPWGMVLQALHHDPWGLQLPKSFSSTRLYHGVQSFRNRLLQRGSPRGCGFWGTSSCSAMGSSAGCSSVCFVRAPPGLLGHLEHLLPSLSVTVGPAEMLHTFFSCSSCSCCAMCFSL